MLNKLQLKHSELRKIFGEIELKTIDKKLKGIKLKQIERNYLSRSIRPKLIAANLLTKSDLIEEINKDNRENQNII